MARRSGAQAGGGWRMSSLRSAEAVRELLELRLEQRSEVSAQFFGDQADRIARLCHRMAERFARDGRLIAVGVSPAARSDVRHVAVEFVHPVIVGKRALPALGLTGESGRASAELTLAAAPEDIVIVFGEPGDGPELAESIEVARACGCLTIAFAALGAEWEFVPPSDDPFVRQELVETLYHVLWELVHVFFEHRGLLEGRTQRRSHDAGASSFLYPFLAEREHDLDAILADVRESALMKAEEVQRLRTETLRQGATVLAETAAALAASFQAGGRLLALGNGGSATDAMDAVADLVGRAGRTRLAPATGARPLRRHRDHHRHRQRHRHRGHLRAPDHRLRSSRRRAAGVLDQRQLTQRPRRARPGPAPPTGDGGAGGL